MNTKKIVLSFAISSFLSCGSVMANDYSGTGSVSHDYYYSGNFSIKSKPIYDKEELALNPIGLFITDFSISEEKETK